MVAHSSIIIIIVFCYNHITAGTIEMLKKFQFSRLNDFALVVLRLLLLLLLRYL